MHKLSARAVASEPSRHSSPAECGLLPAAASRASVSERSSLRRFGSQRVGRRMGLLRKTAGRPLDRPSVASSGRSVGTIAVDDDPDSSANSARHKTSAPALTWSRLAMNLPGLCRASSEKTTATTMYSISFFPWKMEAFGYYSSPWAAAAWVPDTASMRCRICLAAFTLMRRRHHCRLCGHLMCNDCSMPRTYLPFSSTARSQHHLVRDGEPQRTCNACASTLHNMAAQHDPRVHKFTVQASSRAGQGQVSVDRPRHWRAHNGSHREDADKERAVDRKLELTSGLAGLENCSMRLSVCQAEELEEILYAQTLSHSTAPSKQFVVSSQWLEQWLQYVQMDTRSSRLESSGGDQVKRGAPRPGPVTNYSLVDFVSGSLVAKDNMAESAVGSGSGNYHVVSEDVWLAFLRLYGGGPSIEVSCSSTEGSASEAPVGFHHRAQSSDCESPSGWVITELREAPMTPRVVLAQRRVGSSSLRKTELSVAKATTSGSLQVSFDSRSSWAARGPKSDCGPLKRWSVARVLSFRKSATGVGDNADDEVFNSLADRGSRPPSRTRIDSRASRTSGPRSVGVLGRRLERRTAVDGPRLSEEAEAEAEEAATPCSRATIAAISAFAHAATEARRRSSLALSRHPSSQLIGPRSSASAA